MNKQKEPIYTIEEIKLFYNDIKYVTRSLAKESEEFFSCMASYAKIERKDPQGIEAFFCQEEERLKKIENELYQLVHIQNKGKRKFGIRQWKSFQELREILMECGHINKKLKPSPLWFSKENYDIIHDMLDEVQTKTEDSIKSKERINLLWSDDVFLAHNVRFTSEYVDLLNGSSMKYLNVNFWKYRKQIKSLFIGEDSLYCDDEIKRLKKNVATITENDNWLFFKKRKIMEVLGENYIGKDTKFNQIRKNYEVFYSWLLTLPEDLNLTEESFLEYCEFIEQLKNIDWTVYSEMMQECVPFFSDEIIKHTPIEILIEKVQHYRYAINIVKQKYGTAYLTQERIEPSYEKWNKLLQKVLDKYNWIEEKKGQIQLYFGGLYAGLNTDWDLMKECIIDSTKEINGVSERRIKQYQFVQYHENVGEDDVNEDSNMNLAEHSINTIEQAVSYLLENEVSIAISELVKRVSKLLGQKRITAKWKQEVEQYIREHLPESFNIEDDFILIKDKELLHFRVPEDKKKRDAELISMAEWIRGVYSVILIEKEIPLDDLTKLFAKLLGYPRRTKVLQEKVEEAVKHLKKDSKIERKSGGWSIIEM